MNKVVGEPELAWAGWDMCTWLKRLANKYICVCTGKKVPIRRLGGGEPWDKIEPLDLSRGTGGGAFLSFCLPVPLG